MLSWKQAIFLNLFLRSSPFYAGISEEKNYVCAFSREMEDASWRKSEEKLGQVVPAQHC
jgi:hypothetical protein